ncbi:hypothetical protein Q9189_007338, partial [Teloschistes chrysophthalmus]
MSKQMEQSSSANTQEAFLVHSDPIVNLHFRVYHQVIKHGPYHGLLVPILYVCLVLAVLLGLLWKMAAEDVDEILEEQFKHLGVDASTVPSNLKLKIDMLGAVLEERQAAQSAPESSKTGEARQRLKLDATALREMSSKIKEKEKEIMAKQMAEEDDEDIDLAAWMATRTTNEERRADIDERSARFWALDEEAKDFPKQIQNHKKWLEESEAALAETVAEAKEFHPQRGLHQRGIRAQKRLVAEMSAPLRALYAEHAVQHPATTTASPSNIVRNELISHTTSHPLHSTIAKSTTLYTTPKPNRPHLSPEVDHATSLYLRAGAHLRWMMRYEPSLYARHDRLEHAMSERSKQLRQKRVEWDDQRVKIYGCMLVLEAMEKAAGFKTGQATKARARMEEMG